jgi:hypothetical protein
MLLIQENKSLGHENVAFCWLCLQLEVLKRKSLLEDLSDNFTKIGMHDLWYEFAILERGQWEGVVAGGKVWRGCAFWRRVGWVCVD